jgi:DNA-binding NtrC family response regulator
MSTSQARIMVVDDEAPLLNLVKVFLTREGYAVEPFANPTQALNTLQSRAGEFQVLVADLSMPDLSGDQLGIEAAKLNSTLKVLLCSGYPYDVENIPEELRARFASLQKPFMPKEITAAISTLLAR